MRSARLLCASASPTLPVPPTAPLRGDGTVSNTATRPMYGLSQVFEVCDGIWCATLQVRDLGSSHRGCGNASSGNECTVYLSEDEFTHASTDYSVGAARVQSDGQLQLYLSPDITTDSESLVLHVGSETFAFKDANVKEDDHRKWNSSGLSWSTGNPIELKLTDATNATGNPTISGVPQVNRELEARKGNIDDTDGLPSSAFPSGYTFEWVSVDASDVETIVGSNTTYTVSASDEGSTIKVYVSFTDLAGNSEGPLPSEATAAVVPAAGPCPAGNGWCATMTVGTLEAGGTSYGFFFGGIYGQLDETTIDYGPSFEVEEIYIYEPDSPIDDRIHVVLDAYVPLGTVFNLGGTDFTADAGSRVGLGTHIWSRPANFAWIDGQEVRVSANLAPAPESATVDGTTLVLTHSEDLDTSSVPAASAYTVRVDGDAGTNPSTVSVGTRTVTLTLATAVIDGQVVKVSYDMPASNRLQDVSGLEAPDFDNFAVTNNTDNPDVANATGDPTIDGVPQVGMMLAADTSDIEDVDGLPATFTYQWVRIATDNTETDLGTNSTHTVSSSDVDSTIRVDVSFTDLAGNSEGPLPSEATAAVVPAAGPCPAGNDWCATMTVGTSKISGAMLYGFSVPYTVVYGQLDDPTIDYGPSFEVRVIAISEPDLGLDQILVDLNAYVPPGTVFNLGGTEFPANAGRITVAGRYIWDRPADFAWIVGQEVRVSANLTPAPESATVEGTTLVLTHSEDLDTGSVPPASAYTVKVDGDAGTNPSTVSVGTRTVTLTLATPVIDGQVVTVSYDMPASNRLQDVSGRNAPAFNNFAVTNNTETGNSAPTFTEGETTSRSFDETIGDAAVTTATNIGQPVAAMDLDTGDTLTYTLEGTDSVKFDIDYATGQIKTRAGQAYDYEVARIYGFTVAVEDGEGGSDTISVTLDVNNHNEPPLAPTITDVSATSGSTTSLDVSWTVPNNVGRPVIIHYDLQYRQGTSGNWTNGPQDVPITSAPIGSLTPGTSYLVQVRATNADYDDGLWSNSLGGTTNEPGNSAPTFTDGTTAIRTFEETFGDAAVATATNIDEPVSATDVNGDTLTYTLEGQDAGKFDIVSTSGQLLTKVGTQYDYEQQRTYLVTVVVEDSYDNSAEITVLLSVIDQNEPPLAPTPVFVSPTSGSASKLNVSWNPPTNTGRPNITNYDLQYREVDAANYRNGPQNVSGDRTNISGLKSGTRYQVQVRATNAEGDGPWTPAVEGSTSQNSEPDPPSVTHGLRATGVSQTRIDLSWNAPTDDGGASITGYRIEVSDDGGSTWSDLIANTGNSNRTYAHTSLTAGVTRHYRVSAINRVGTGLASAVASGQTQAAGAKPKRPGTMYIYFTVSDTDLNESEEATYTGNSIEGDCSREKYFRAYWIEKNNPPVDEWEVRAEHDDDVSDLRTQVRYSNGNREHPEFIGSARFAAGPDKTSSIHFAVRGRYGSTWGPWGRTSVLQCKHTE